MQIAPSHNHSIGILEAQKINFAKHNETQKNLPHASVPISRIHGRGHGRKYPKFDLTK